MGLINNSGSSQARSVLLASLLCFCGLLLGCEQGPDSWQFSGPTMGTHYHVTVVGESEQKNLSDQQLAVLADGVQAELDAVNQAMSTYIADSELSQLNASNSDQWQSVSASLAEVLAEAIDIAEVTDGALDVTLGPLVDLWGFGATGQRTTPPSDEAIADLLAQLGMQQLAVTREPPRLRKPSHVVLDLSAIAKGYGVDRVAAYLQSQGYRNYLVEVGGEIVVNGHNPAGEAWRIGVEKPSLGRQGVQQALKINQGAVATSGDYRNYFEVAGRRYSHLLDPRTGRPVDHDTVSVTVIADTATRADGLATALTVMGAEAALALAERQEWAIYVIMKTGEGFVTSSSSEFAVYFD